MGRGVPTAAIVVPSSGQNGTYSSSSSSSSPSSSSGFSPNTSTTMDLNDAPYLLMLVPTDGIDWGLGSNWGENHQAEGSNGGWMEVGCRMTSIRMVSNQQILAHGCGGRRFLIK